MAILDLTAEIEYTLSWRFIWSCIKLRLLNPKRAKGLKLQITDHNLRASGHIDSIGEVNDYLLKQFEKAREFPTGTPIPFVKYNWERHQYDFGVKEHQGAIIVRCSVSYGLHPGFYSPDERQMSGYFDAVASELLAIAKHRPREIQ